MSNERFLRKLVERETLMFRIRHLQFLEYIIRKDDKKNLTLTRLLDNILTDGEDNCGKRYDINIDGCCETINGDLSK